MKRRTRLLALLLLVLMLPGIAGCSGPGKKEAVEAFEQESEKLSFQMRKLQEAIEVAESWLTSGKEPADSRVRDALEKKLEEAKAIQVEIPEMPSKKDEIIAATEKMKEQEPILVLSELGAVTEAFRKSVREAADAALEAKRIEAAAGDAAD